MRNITAGEKKDADRDDGGDTEEEKKIKKVMAMINKAERSAEKMQQVNLS